MRVSSFPRARALPPSPWGILLCVIFLVTAPALAGPAVAQIPERTLPGEDMSDPLWIDQIPWVVTGNSCDYGQDYDEMCPYGAWSPDVVYAFTPEWSMVVTIDLCSSYYDTKLLVYQNSHLTLHACSDDACSGPHYPWPYLSRIEHLPLAAGNTYYFVVKGYGSECGVYVMGLAVESPCVVPCPDDALLEGEPECHDGYVDVYNGGCDADAPAFQPIDPGAQPLVLCGTSGTYTTDFIPRRDTDWYAFALTARSEMSVLLAAEFEAKLHLFHAGGGCDDPLLIEGASAGACGAALSLDTLEAGDYWLRVSPAPESDTACGARYVLGLELRADPAGVVPAVDPHPRPATVGPRVLVTPQPAHGRAEILLTLPEPAPLEVSLLDPTGRCVRTLLAPGEPVARALRLVWDGCDREGHPVPGGLYLCRATTPAGSVTVPLLCLR